VEGRDNRRSSLRPESIMNKGKEGEEPSERGVYQIIADFQKCKNWKNLEILPAARERAVG